MDDIIDALHKAGVPSALIAALAVGWLILDKLKLVPRPSRKSERELLSTDQESFRRALMARNDQQDKRIAALEADLQRCHAAHDELHAWIAHVVGAVKAAGLDALIKMTPPARLAPRSGGS